MRKVREYKGCEWESPIYRQIIAEKEAKENKGVINEYKTKRGKRRLKALSTTNIQLIRIYDNRLPKICK